MRIWYGIVRNAMETYPRCRNALTRNLARFGTSYERSTSPSSSNSVRWRSSAIEWSAFSVSLAERGSDPSTGRSAPWIRAIGGESTLTWRSDPSRSTT